jgi:hypothetical protein
MPAAPPPLKAEAATAPNPQESLSQLIAKILDQLTVSAWLPAALLVLLALMFGTLETHDGDVQAALDGIVRMNLASFALLIAAVIVTTLLTQAFEFEAIRVLEGYWGTGRISSFLAEWRCRRHAGIRNKLTSALAEVDTRAFAVARQAMLDTPMSRDLIDILEAERHGASVAGATEADIARARAMPWEKFAKSADLRRKDDLEKALRAYPATDRLIKPTRLGNTLRAYEEPILRESPGNLENYVRLSFHTLPSAMQTEHDQFRRRLDLYCSLVVTSLLTTLAGATILAVGGWKASCFGLAVATALFGWLSYRAAIASARGYGSVLETISEFRQTPAA